MATASDDAFLLHRLVYTNSIEELTRELKVVPAVDKEVINAPDKHGCTPLIIAVMKNHKGMHCIRGVRRTAACVSACQCVCASVRTCAQYGLTAL